MAYNLSIYHVNQAEKCKSKSSNNLNFDASPDYRHRIKLFPAFAKEPDWAERLPEARKRGSLQIGRTEVRRCLE